MSTCPPGVDIDAGTLPLPLSFSQHVTPLVVSVSVAGTLLAMATVVVRYRRLRGLERHRMRGSCGVSARWR